MSDVDERARPRASTPIRWLVGISGVLAILLGVFVLLQPAAALLAVAWLFGIYFIAIGVFRVAHAALATGARSSYRWLTGILGVLVVIGGVLVLTNPGLGVLGLAIAIGVTWIVDGVIATAVSVAEETNWWAVLYGVLSIIAGGIVIGMPFMAAGVLLIGAAIFAILSGVVQLVRAIVGPRRSITRAGAGSTSRG